MNTFNFQGDIPPIIQSAPVQTFNFEGDNNCTPNPVPVTPDYSCDNECISGSLTTEQILALINSKQKPSPRDIFRDDPHWENDQVTYTDLTLSGIQFRVMFNSGNRFLTVEDDGFQIVPTGGFTTDPNKFILLDGQHLIMLF